MALDHLYTAVRGRIGDTLGDAGAGVDTTPVPSCPDWNVAQLTAHLAGTIRALVDGDGPGGDTQAWVDGHVAARAGRTAQENWEEWNEAGPAFEQLLLSNPRGYGPLLYDAVIHEDDINAALGRPSPRDAEAVTYGLERVFWRLDRDARKLAVGTLEVTTSDGVRCAGEGEPLVRLHLDDRWEVLRALGSRRSERQLRALPFDGDIGPWLPALPHELPVHDLDER